MTRPRPQRLFAPSPPGSLLKRAVTVLRPKNPEADHDPAYLDQVRDCPCLHCGMDPCYEAAHVRMASAAHGKASGMGKKPADRWAAPLCPDHHRLLATCQHHRGEQLFWAELGINPLLTCQLLYAQRGDLVAMRAVIFTTISQRGNSNAGQ